MKKVQITATYSGTTYPIFSGFITSYVNTQPKDATEVAYTTITAVDAMRLAQNAQISTVTGATAGDLSGTRINQILDEIDWPASMR
jgi:outer membrane lipoprotein SlyB